MNVSAAPAINRLILVTHNADVLAYMRQQQHQFVLAAVGVLIFVDHHELELPVVAQPQFFIVFQQAH